MGGGSALLINSNRRGGQTDFGCEGWFCDVLNAAMSILVLMIIGTALFGCYRSCCKKKKTMRPAPPKSAPRHQNGSEDVPETHGPSEDVRITVEDVEGKSPPDYSENDNRPPEYSTLRFDSNGAENV